MPDTTWSPQQDTALALAGAWLRLKYSPVFYLAGYAGTGKSTLANEIASHVKGKVAFAAYTGKAARVMARKGCRDAKTIHSLIYHTEITTTGRAITTLKPKDALDDFKLIVIDECSMVNEQMGKDLLSFGVPALVLGDPAQLPPISGGGYFTSQEPAFMLTEVHRQAAESPILRLATDVREGRYRATQRHEDGLTIVDRKRLAPERVTSADIIIVGRNATRQKFNRSMREIGGKNGPMPVKGEPVICLRNSTIVNIANGEMFEVEKAVEKADRFRLWLSNPDTGRKLTPLDVRQEFFVDDMAAARIPHQELRDTHQFTYGYAITCHKAQGSQWEDVCVFDESGGTAEDRRRWLYTAVTRSTENLTLVV